MASRDRILESNTGRGTFSFNRQRTRLLGGGLVSLALLLVSGCSSSSGSSSTAEAATPAMEPAPDPEPARPTVMVQKGTTDPLQVTFRLTNAEEFQEDGITWTVEEDVVLSGAEATHRFGEGGTHVARLEAIDLENFSIEQEVQVELNAPPSVRLSRTTPITGSRGLGLVLEAVASDPDGEIRDEDIRWRFADDTRREGRRVEYYFPSAGLHKFQIFAIDSQGAITSIEEMVEVERLQEIVVSTPSPTIEEELQEEEPAPQEPEPAPEPVEEPEAPAEPEEIVEPAPEEPAVEEPAVEEPGEDLASLEPDLPESGSPEAPASGGEEGESSEPAPAPETIDPSLIDDLAGLIADPVTLGFEVFEDWMDGVLFTLASAEGSAYSGASSLEIRLDREGSIEPALVELESRLQALDGQGEVHLRWNQMWDGEVRLDVDAIRPSVDAHWDVIRQNLSVGQRNFFLEVLSEIEKAGSSGFPGLVAGTWYCFQVSFYASTDGLSNGSLVVSVSGVEILDIKGLAYPVEPVISSSVLPFVLLLEGVNTNATRSWVDELSLHTSALSCAP